MGWPYAEYFVNTAEVVSNVKLAGTRPTPRRYGSIHGRIHDEWHDKPQMSP
jgi:hypothetical protein